MLNLIARLVSRIQLLLTKLMDQPLVKQLAGKIVPGFLMGTLLLATGVDSSASDQSLGKTVDKVIHQDREKRPKTTGEWNQQSREVQGKPGKLLKRVGEQSAEAVKDFGSVFPDTAKRSAAELKK
jgi:hypothetical protein